MPPDHAGFGEPMGSGLHEFEFSQACLRRHLRTALSRALGAEIT